MKFTSTTAKLVSLFLALFVVLAMSGGAYAEIKRANGGACDSTGSERKDGKDQDGNKMNCKWDTCTYTECSTAGGQVSNCVKKTEYSNPTDCHPALTSHGGADAALPFDNLQLQMDPGNSGPTDPTRPTHGFLVSMQVAISEPDLRQACDEAKGMFASGKQIYQCVAGTGDVLSCRVDTHYCTGSLVVHKRPKTLFGFATAPFGQGAGHVPPAADTGDHGGGTGKTPTKTDGSGSSQQPPDNTPVIY